MKEKTYGELYKELLDKSIEDLISDYRPAESPYIDDLFGIGQFVDSNIFIENGIVVWLKDGSTIIYVGKDE